MHNPYLKRSQPGVHSLLYSNSEVACVTMQSGFTDHESCKYRSSEKLV